MRIFLSFQESLFFAAEALTVLQWSRASDFIGRKPVLLIGVAGLCISMICFGLSKTFFGLVLRYVTKQHISNNCWSHCVVVVLSVC